MANTAALGTDEIGVRFQKLNLPARPLIMDKWNGSCRNHQQACFCYEYTTLLDRPEYTGKYLLESPEPEARTTKVSSGSTTAKRKLKLDQYMAGKTTTPKTEQRSSETSPNNATNAPTRSTPVSTTSSQGKISSSHANTPNLSKSSTTALMSSSRAPKASIPAKRIADISPDASKSSAKTLTPDVPRPVKRQRTSPPPRQIPPPPPSRRTPPRRTATPSFPPLPALLSPTLPKVIEDALAAEDNLDNEIIAKPNRDRKAPNGIAPKASQANKKLPGSSSVTPSRRSPRPVASPGKTFPKKSGLGTVASKTTGKRPSSPNPASPRPSKISSKHLPVSTAPQKIRIVRLKFRRRLKDFQALVKFSANKRPRPMQDENGSAKHKTAPGSLNVPKPSTVRSPAFKSPAVKAPKDREVVTPPQKKGNGSSVIKKSESRGGAAITPASNREDRNGFARGPASSQFQADYEKFSALGKSTKHEADAVFRASLPDPKELRRALVVAADSTLCFVLAFVLSDRSRQLEGRGPAVEIWRTFIPLSVFVSDKAKSQNAPTLHGFCKQMEAIVRQHLFDMDVSAFSKTSPPENSSKAPTPDSSNSGATDRNKYMTLKGRIVQDTRDLRECWLEGIKYLTYDDIQRDFPNTYNARSSKWIEPIPGLPKAVGKYRQAFQLPLHRNTTPLEALNFGRRFLEEWASENGIKYKSRLNEWL